MDKKLFIETYGCQMNVADSEVVAAIMQSDGYMLTDKITEADAILVNTCSIRDNAEQKVLGRLQYFQSLRRKNKNLIVGVIGCMAERVQEDLINNHGVNFVAGPDAYLDLPNLVGAAERGEKAINVELNDQIFQSAGTAKRIAQVCDLFFQVIDNTGLLQNIFFVNIAKLDLRHEVSLDLINSKTDH